MYLDSWGFALVETDYLHSFIHSTNIYEALSVYVTRPYFFIEFYSNLLLMIHKSVYFQTYFLLAIFIFTMK